MWVTLTTLLRIHSRPLKFGNKALRWWWMSYVSHLAFLGLCVGLLTSVSWACVHVCFLRNQMENEKVMIGKKLLIKIQKNK